MIYLDNTSDVHIKTKVDCNYQNFTLNNEYRREFKNVEEDIATLLANQLSSQENPTSSGSFTQTRIKILFRESKTFLFQLKIGLKKQTKNLFIVLS